MESEKSINKAGAGNDGVMSEQKMSEQQQEHLPPAEGWVQIPIRRGVFEISRLLDLRDKCGGRIIGGYARWCCSERQSLHHANDVDIFPIAEKEGDDSLKIYDAWKTAFIVEGLKVKHENEVSISYEKPESGPFLACPTIQLIKPTNVGAILTEGTVEEVLGNFDFTIVRVALNPDRLTATAWASFIEDDNKGLLRILNIHCPVSSLLRVCKYARKGYYCRPAEAMKLFFDWEQRTPEYRLKIFELFQKGNLGEISKEEIEELEKLLHVD
jgi:hypothetical protein